MSKWKRALLRALHRSLFLSLSCATSSPPASTSTRVSSASSSSSACASSSSCCQHVVSASSLPRSQATSTPQTVSCRFPTVSAWHHSRHVPIRRDHFPPPPHLLPPPPLRPQPCATPLLSAHHHHHHHDHHHHHHHVPLRMHTCRCFVWCVPLIASFAPSCAPLHPPPTPVTRCSPCDLARGAYNEGQAAGLAEAIEALQLDRSRATSPSHHHHVPPMPRPPRNPSTFPPPPYHRHHHPPHHHHRHHPPTSALTHPPNPATYLAPPPPPPATVATTTTPANPTHGVTCKGGP
jgi:hypothetical protein